MKIKILMQDESGNEKPMGTYDAKEIKIEFCERDKYGPKDFKKVTIIGRDAEEAS